MIDMTNLPLLSLILIAPLAGTALVWLWPNARAARMIGLLASAAALLFSLLALIAFDPGYAGFQLIDRAAWIPSLNANYLIGVDGISLLFLPLTVLLFLGVVLASWNNVTHLPRLYFSLLLMQLAATLGVFVALDTLLFFLFWEMSLVPFYFLVSLWGVGGNRRYAATKYTHVMLAGGVPLLFGFLILAFNYAASHGGALAFDLPTLLATPLSKPWQITVFLLLLVGFGVKTPLFPLHTWLPMTTNESPVAVAALLVGLKLGAYGLIRFTLPLAPQAAHELHWLLAGLGTVAVLYGAIAALAQTNLRRMLAYSSLSHVGLVVLGLASLDIQGVQGAVLQTLNFIVAAGGVFLLTAFLHARIGSTDVLNLGGVARTMPLLAGFFLLLTLAGLGVPGTNSFPAELLILLSALKNHTGAGLAALLAMVIGAAYALSLYRRAFFGPVKHEAVAQAVDLQPRELALAMVFALLVLGVGIFPGPVLELIRPAAEAWVAHLR